MWKELILYSIFQFLAASTEKYNWFLDINLVFYNYNKFISSSNSLIPQGISITNLIIWK